MKHWRPITKTVIKFFFMGAFIIQKEINSYGLNQWNSNASLKNYRSIEDFGWGKIHFRQLLYESGFCKLALSRENFESISLGLLRRSVFWNENFQPRFFIPSAGGNWEFYCRIWKSRHRVYHDPYSAISLVLMRSWCMFSFLIRRGITDSFLTWRCVPLAQNMKLLMRCSI